MERIWEVERDRGSDVLRAETLAELGGAAGSSRITSNVRSRSRGAGP